MIQGKPIGGIDLASGEFEGLYELSNGHILEAHEWLDPDWSEYDEEPDGSVYYDIYDGLTEGPIDGGVIGYSKGETMAYVSEWLIQNGQPAIIRLIVRETDPRYNDLFDALWDPSMFNDVAGDFGLARRASIKASPNARPKRRGYLR